MISNLVRAQTFKSSESRSSVDRSQPETDAENHIRKIRKKKGLNSGNGSSKNNSEDLETALTLVLNLYDEPTHFLMEFIQNADDNSYPDQAIPTLNLTYRAGCLRVDCNETGFSPENVEALCNIGRSTKTAGDHPTASIGGRGIGFKSVFRAADVVWIASRSYSFKFDKNEVLGTIAPIWEKFPEQRNPELTSFYLELSKGYDEQRLVQEIRSIDPAVFLFLRRLRTMDLTLGQGEKIWKTNLSRLGSDVDEEMVTLMQGSTCLRYIVRRHRVDGLPPEPKRPGCSQSEIVLAFPIESNSEEPRSSPQKVYAFLPIRDYGFVFILHADFLLTTDHGSIETSCQWNQSLCDGWADAFTKAIDSFQTGTLRYTWPRYLPSTPVSNLLEQPRKEIISALRTMRILESCAGSMHTPPSLTYVPVEFMDDNNMPLTLSPHTSSKYLLPKYSSQDWAAMSELGVSKLSEEGFLADLDALVRSYGLRDKPKQWRSKLAEVLLRLASEKKHWPVVSALQIIPLRDGNWASARNSRLFFSKDSGGSKIPNGIPIIVVDPIAEADPDQRKLFIQLGVKLYGSPEICRLILDRHGNPNFDAISLSREQLISHAKFLFAASFSPPSNSEVWFATEQDRRSLGSKLYVDEDPATNSSASCFFKNERYHYPFLHSDYLTAFPQERRRDWISYLCKHFNLSTLPRLVDPLLGSSFVLSDDFKFVFENYPTSKVLRLLRDHWSHYSKWIGQEIGEDGRLGPSAKAELRSALAQTKVKCANGRDYSLCDTFFPSVDQVIDRYSILPTLPILNVDDPESEGWQMLGILGITMKKNVRLYLLCLEGMEGSDYPHSTISYIYEQIQALYNDNGPLLKDKFGERRLIYVQHKDTSMRWLKAQDCMQQDSACPTAIGSLEAQYPTCITLFRKILEDRDEGLAELVADATFINSSGKLSDILRLLVKINKALRTLSLPRDSKFVEILRDKPIFPTRKDQQESRFDCVSASDTRARWFIADDQNLFERFRGKVSLLAFRVREVEEISNLLQEMQLDSRRLSKTVKSENSPKGRPYLHPTSTSLLESRAGFIKRLIPDSNLHRNHIYLRLKNAEVYEVPSITQSWILTYGEFKVIGRPTQDQFAAYLDDDGYRIFLTEDGIASPLPPPGLVDKFSTVFDIKDSAQRTLLQDILSNISLETIRDIFRKEGIPLEDDERKRTAMAHPTEYERPSWHAIYLKADRPPHAVGSNVKRWHLPPIKTKPSPFTELSTQMEPKHSPTAERTRYTESVNANLIDMEGIMTLPPFKQGGDGATSINTSFLGELMTSRFLGQQLGKAYHPEEHWTSNKRGRAGYAPYASDRTSHSSFTLHSSCARALTGFLVQYGYSDAIYWKRRPPIYHLDISTTSGDAQSPFPWTLARFDRARELSLVSAYGANPDEIMILARVCNVYSDARLYLYVDPWRLYVSGQLRVHEDGGLMATTSNTLPVAPLANSCLTSGLQSWAASIVEFFIEGDEEDAGGVGDTTTLSTALAIGSDLSTYSYNRLSDKESIRLLFLLPGEAGTDLRGAIFHTSLESAGQYNAVSYVWGDTKKPHILQTPNGTIPITISLFSALQRLRLKGQPTTLWVDAICINQDDSEEKSQQVRLIPRIFRLACNVMADLGEEDSQSHLAMETLLQIKMREAKELPEWLAPVSLVWGGKCIPPAEDAAWAAIDALFSRPWFRRAWVIQEFVAARRVRFLCGERSVDWNDLLRAIKVAEREIKASGDEYMAHGTNWGHIMTLAEHREWEAKRTRWPLIHLLESFGYAEATLQRDRLFALLGLADDGSDPDFQPDYHTDTLLEDIMLRYARKFVKQGKVTNLLHRAGLNSKSERFPSWIPDWTTFKEGTLYDSSGLGIPCAASGYSEPRCNFNSTKDELVIQGIFVDEVTSVSESTNAPWSLGPYLSEVDKMVDSLREYPTGESLSDIKWKVPIAGAKHPEEVVSAPLDLHSSYQALKELLASGSAPDILKMRAPGFLPPQDADDSDNKKQQSLLTCQNYVNALQGVLLGWKFIVTKRGYVGIASNQPQERDLVAVFSGGVVPFLLRKSKRRAGAYHLVGECYIHGIMLGEEWSSSGVGKIRLH
ncbi:MAG: hypothetical protein M1840_008998 [Geoglossum simile]|nr:MAG: hypothetical protein M1840_008998 [Geoglossum simile]